MKEESLAVGGQAIIEGVMMRKGHHIIAAIRTPQKTIITKRFPYKPIEKRMHILGWPFIRGIVSLLEILFIGLKILMWSSSQQLEEEEELKTRELIITIVIAILFSVVIFKFLPLLVASLIQNQTQGSNALFNVIDGIIRIALLIGYIALISLMKDVKRLFQYHGAEHKTIHAYEKGQPLTPKSVKKQPRLHPRCGTTFILFVFFISILVYMIIPLDTGFWGKLGLRLLLLPLISGISYELIRLAGRHSSNPIMKALVAPGMGLQLLTTKEPDKEQIEVAITSLKATLASSRTHP